MLEQPSVSDWDKQRELRSSCSRVILHRLAHLFATRRSFQFARRTSGLGFGLSACLFASRPVPPDLQDFGPDQAIFDSEFLS
jgi:hypothetical protein